MAGARPCEGKEHRARRTASTNDRNRRAFEVEESIGQMRDVGVEPVMAEAIVRRLKKSAALGTREELGGVAPKTLEDVYGIWRKKEYC